MLTSTFIHAQGVGYATEKKLWDMGVVSWDDYIRTHTAINLPERKKSMILPTIQESISALASGDDLYFARKIPSCEHWRAAEHFGQKGKIAYLDIETTGCGDYDDITVIGYYNGYEMMSFVKGQNIDDFPDAIAGSTMLVTFFGSGFDLPFIRRKFPRLKLNQLHVDLCYMMRKLGYSGGLKRIENIAGIRRTPETDGLSGMDAVLMWNEYLKGSSEALRLLLLYNKEDVVNMETLFNIAYAKMQEKIDIPCNILI